MKQFSLFALFAIFLISPGRAGAQSSVPKTLLWRITGNGLQKPSYLFGTMHLKDRRLFYFGDSVYNSIESVEAFAMELDPNEMMDSIFSKIGDADTSTLLKKLLDEKKFNSVAKKLEKKFGMSADKISRKQLLSAKDNWYYNLRKNDDMNAVVDLYLYNVARKQGKHMGGIEDVSDQLNLQDELGKDVNISEYVTDDKEAEKKVYLEKMIGLYVAEDIEKIQQIVDGSGSQESLDILLVKRNVKMARRMDSLAHNRSSFFAIGTAHLPGETGVIRLLQNKGFRVEPVFSSRKLAPEKYSHTVQEIPWIKFTEPDSAYTVELPARPGDLKMAEDIVKFKVYADMVTGTFYMTGFSMFAGDEQPGALTDRMIGSFLQRGFEKKTEKKITNRGNNGTEITAVMGKIFYRMQVFPFADKLFILMVGGEKKETLYSSDAERMLNSFEMNASLRAKPNKWSDYPQEATAFAISFPKKPGVDKLPVEQSGKNIQALTYTTLDLANNNYYMVLVTEPLKGFVMSEDSVVFKNKLDYYAQNKATVKDIRYFKFDGNSACSFAIESSKDGLNFVTKMLMVCRGNRDYTVVVVAQKGKEDYPDITRFFRSFKLLPYSTPLWSKNTGHGTTFSTWTPSAIEAQLPDTTGLSAGELENTIAESKKLLQFIAHDANAATSFNINIRPSARYFSIKDDTSFLNHELANYYSDTASNYAKMHPGRFDSLVAKKAVSNGHVKGFEVIIKNDARSYYKRLRVLPHGDSAYSLFVMAPYDYITSANSNKFFEDFRFSDEAPPTSLYNRKTSLLLADLSSHDEDTKAGAVSALRNTEFDAEDLPLLFRAFLQKYPVDSNAYQTINDQLAGAIGGIHDSSVISFVKDNYLAGTKQYPALRMHMLSMLARQQTLAGVTTLKKLLLESPPVEGRQEAVIDNLNDSVALAATLFPEAARFFGDSILGTGMLSLASMLIDSNRLDKKILSSNLDAVLVTAKAELARLNRGNYSGYYEDVIRVLGKLEDPKSTGLLNRFLQLSDLDIKQAAALQLLQINQQVPPAQLRKIAADRNMRAFFYTELVKIGKRHFFPAEFLSQQKFAESYVYAEVSGDDEFTIKSLIPITEKLATVNGRPQRFYLYKIVFDDTEDHTSHLAICGGFDTDRKNPEVKNDQRMVRIFYDEPFNATANNHLFDEFIAAQNNPPKTGVQ